MNAQKLSVGHKGPDFLFFRPDCFFSAKILYIAYFQLLFFSKMDHISSKNEQNERFGLRMHLCGPFTSKLVWVRKHGGFVQIECGQNVFAAPPDFAPATHGPLGLGDVLRFPRAKNVRRRTFVHRAGQNTLLVCKSGGTVLYLCVAESTHGPRTLRLPNNFFFRQRTTF